MLQKIKTALISVSDKKNCWLVLKILKKHKIKIISSGGTYGVIKKFGFDCSEVSAYTGFQEMLGGRVKTLHPKIHAGILHNRASQKHTDEMNNNDFPSIDLVVVNLYPFKETIAEGCSFEEAIEKIDIGGPTMIRSAAKNFKNVLIITKNPVYKDFIKDEESGEWNNHVDLGSWAEAFGLTAYYDSMIASWFNKRLKIEFPERKTIFGRKLKQLRYGENPHQQSSIYVNDYDDKELGFNILGGKELSYNNYNDMFVSKKILKSIKKITTTVIIKHANPCGVSTNISPLNSFKNAFASDPLSAFGGVVACNYKIDKSLAKLITNNFLEIIMARGFEKTAIDILKKKKNLINSYISKYKEKNLGNQSFTWFYLFKIRTGWCLTKEI